MKNPGISVVIPNYNGVNLFPQTLPGIFKALENSGRDYEVIVADDFSTDDSVAYLQQAFPKVRVLEHPSNTGFSKTANRGILASKLELILILNSDVKLSPDYFLHLLPYFQRPDVFGVTGKILGWDDDQVQDAVKFPVWQGNKLKFSLNYLPDDEKVDCPTFYLSGANAFVSREKLALLSGFNEDYSPFYVEDVDLSVRAWRMGWSCFFESKAICRHKTSTTISSQVRKDIIKQITTRNKLYFHRFHHQGIRLQFWYIQMFAELLFRIMLGHKWFYRGFVSYREVLPELKSKRKAFEKAKNQSLYDIVRNMSLSAGKATGRFFKS